MALYKIIDKKVQKLIRNSFNSEKELQQFIENNLEELFGIRFLASEYSTNGGRIDTLGIDEDNSPVIIEYKWGENQTIINQGLFYMDWLVDHIADFQILVQKKLHQSTIVDAGSPRLLLIAASYSKYDSFAINRMSENIEMWTYNFFEDLFELKLSASKQAKTSSAGSKVTKINYDTYKSEYHLEGKSKTIKEIFKSIQERILSFDPDNPVEEVVRKMYIAYRTNRNFVYLNFRNDRILFDVPITVEKISSIDKSKVRDMRGIGHHGAGYSRYDLNNFNQVDEALKLIRESFDQTK